MSFSNSKAALQCYVENGDRFTLLIADLTMPAPGGPEVIGKARAVNPRLPVLLITGYSEDHITDDLKPLIRRLLTKAFIRAERKAAMHEAFSPLRGQYGWSR